MTDVKLEYFTGECPIQNRKAKIGITFQEISINQTLKRHYKATNFKCNYAETETCNLANECPVYLENKFKYS